MKEIFYEKNCELFWLIACDLNSLLCPNNLMNEDGMMVWYIQNDILELKDNSITVYIYISWLGHILWLFWGKDRIHLDCAGPLLHKQTYLQFKMFILYRKFKILLEMMLFPLATISIIREVKHLNMNIYGYMWSYKYVPNFG